MNCLTGWLPTVATSSHWLVVKLNVKSSWCTFFREKPVAQQNVRDICLHPSMHPLTRMQSKGKILAACIMLIMTILKVERKSTVPDKMCWHTHHITPDDPKTIFHSPPFPGFNVGSAIRRATKEFWPELSIDQQWMGGRGEFCPGSYLFFTLLLTKSRVYDSGVDLWIRVGSRNTQHGYLFPLPPNTHKVSVSEM